MSLLKEFKEILVSFQKVAELLHKKEKASLLSATVLMIIVGILTNLPAVILGKFVDNIIGSSNPTFSIAIPFLVWIVIILIAKEVLTVIRKYLVENVATQTEKKQTVSVVKHLLKTDINSFINKYQIGALHGKVFRSIQGLIRLIKLGFLDFFPTFFSALAALGIAFYQKPLLASFMILVIPAGLFIVIKQISSQKGIRVRLLRGKEEIDGKVVEMMGGLETIRVANTVENEARKVNVVSEMIRRIEMKHHIWMSIYDAMKYLNEAFFYVLVISISIYFAVNGIITKGDILTYSILFMSVLGPLREIHRILDQAHESTIKVQDLQELLAEPVDESFKAQGTKLKNKTNLVLATHALKFNYGKKNLVLDNVTITVAKGEKIGIVGASGCGKSTLVKILLRLLHDYQGKVMFLGKDLKKITRKEIAQKVAYVPQKAYVFSGTIKDNIVYGCSKKVSEREIINAAKKANMYAEIKKLGGLNSVVAEKGDNLSGGQKQRLALARLILKSPDVLIFDEATSALDNTNESIIQRNLENIFSDKTMFTIAHRLTTLKNCDRILVFDKGNIVQEGTFNELKSKKGLFRQFLEQKETR
ncbi:ABC transporter [Candidatus Woesearchaeota archaeon CG10_big_fil_rev_8_21_14_0_10_37_12]|nr:MAG: ABC transporter [Candidatus Woesearchaeota archaeon CG10_big_fil_rev_8_21_14_0_10_37_12]